MRMTHSRQAKHRSLIALLVSGALTCLLLSATSWEADQAEVERVVRAPRSVPVDSVGTYFTKQSSGVITTELLPTGEYLRTYPQTVAVNPSHQEKGSFAADRDHVRLVPDTGNLDLGMLSDQQESYVRVNWGCCRLLVREKNMQDFCKAANAGSASPIFKELESTVLRSTTCVGRHLDGIASVPEKWSTEVLGQPILMQINWTTWANVARVNAGEDMGLKIGMHLYSKHKDGRLITYRVVNVYARTADIKELDMPPGWTLQRQGAYISTWHPDGKRI